MATQRERFLFSGTITTVAPLAYSPPDHRNRDGCLRVPRIPVPGAAGLMDTVYLSGSTIRGAFRHACAAVWLEREAPVTLERYLECTVGGVKGSSEEPRVGLAEREAYLESDPFLELLGAGSSYVGWIHSRLDVGAALPDAPVEAVRMGGARREVSGDPAVLAVVNEAGRGAVSEGREANRRRSRAAAEAVALERRLRQMRRAKEDLGEVEHALDAARAAARAAGEAQCAVLGSDVSVQLPLPGYEAIPPGTVLSHRMMARGVEARHMALFLGGLERFAHDPRFGAKRAQGCGRVRVDYVVRRLEGTHAHPVGTVSIDSDRWDRDGSSLAVSGEPARWLAAWHAGAR